jgi:hypothetical protein
VLDLCRFKWLEWWDVTAFLTSPRPVPRAFSLLRVENVSYRCGPGGSRGRGRERAGPSPLQVSGPRSPTRAHNSVHARVMQLLVAWNVA